MLDEAASGENWFLKGGNVGGQHFSPLQQVNDKNIADLGLAWATTLPVPDGISATPIVVDGVVYLSGAYSLVFALDAASGDILWQYDPDVRSRLAEDPGMSWTARVNRGVAVWQGKVFVTTADCRLIALDAASGKAVWQQQTCDRGAGLRDHRLALRWWRPGVRGQRRLGVARKEPWLRFRVRRRIAASCAGASSRFPATKPEENKSPAMKMAAATWSGDALEKFGGGGSAWNEMTYDPASGLLFFGTGGALPYPHHIRSPDGGDNLFLSSVIAVNAKTGEYVWHYQTVPADSWEYNATMNIVLADLEIGGKPRKTLLIAPKNGFHYVLDRLTGEFIAAEKYAKVNWATHINKETGRPVYSPGAQYWKTPDQAVAIWPNMWGAHSWNAMAYHPGHKLVYIPVIDVPTIVTDYADGDFDDTLEITRKVDGESFDPGKLVAWDPVRNRARWSIGHELPFNGGVLATAGNLVFQGDAFGRFSAFRADSGHRLWSVVTGSNITASPVSYAVAGTQYVLVPVGAGGGVQFVYPEMHAGDTVRGPTRLMAFAVDADRPLPDVTTVARAQPPQPELTATAAQLEKGRKIFSYECKGCHGKQAVARFGGSVPDLRYASSETHEQWHGIVIGGARQAAGMPRYAMSLEDSEAVRSYVLSRSVALRESR